MINCQTVRAGDCSAFSERVDHRRRPDAARARRRRFSRRRPRKNMRPEGRPKRRDNDDRGFVTRRRLRLAGCREAPMGKTQKRNFLVTAAAIALICGAVSSAYALDPTPKWCSGVKIAAFPGGPQGGVFANNVYNGYRQAELDLGPSVTYYFSNWDPNLMITQLQQAIATKVDGIAFMGHPRRRGDRSADRQGVRPGHHLHHGEHRAARQPGEIRARTAWATSARPITPRASRSARKRPSAPDRRRATSCSSGASRARAATAASARSA